jgi:hypothetical protein
MIDVERKMEKRRRNKGWKGRTRELSAKWKEW